MYRCELGKHIVKSRQRQNKVVIKTRPQEYFITILQYKNIKKKIKYIHRQLTQEEKDEWKEKRWKVIKEFRTKGTEIVKEINACDKCIKEKNKSE
jgi:hypothetical protein